jgi:hypothetical protein
MMLHIWKLPCGKKRSEDDMESQRSRGILIIVRFCVKDVVTMFVGIVYEGEGPLVETVAAFGPRERVSGVVELPFFCFCFWYLTLAMQKSPYSQSDFTALQTLSKKIAHTIESCPTVSFQSFVVSLRNYLITRG